MCTKRYWYLYQGSGNELLPANYVVPTLTEPNCAAGTSFACKIFVCGGAIHPTPNAITPNIMAYLVVVKVNGYTSYPLTGQPYAGARI